MIDAIVYFFVLHWISITFVWLAAGYVGFVFWWTKDDDLTLFYAVLGLVVISWLGPLAWLLGYVLHGDYDVGEPYVVIKRRKRHY